MPQRVSKVSDVLEAKTSAVHWIKPAETLAKASQQLQRERIGVLIVSDDGQTVKGIISERDLAYGLSLHKAELHALPVSALMTTKVVTCSPDSLLADAVRIMAEKHIRHLPVIDADKLVGIIGMRDAVIFRLQDVQRTARLMSSAIAADLPLD